MQQNAARREATGAAMVKATRALVKAKIAQVFPDRDAAEVLAILDRYGTGRREQERDRVQFAIPEICDADGRDDPAGIVATAKQDIRDVLAWAESPNLMRRTFIENSNERARLKQRDEAQYRAWLGKR